MKILRSFTIIAVLAGASTVYAQTPVKAKEAPAKAPEKAPAPPVKADKAAPKSELSAQDAEKFMAFFNKFVDAIVATKDDCNKMATSINGIVDANQELIKKANQAKNEGKDLPQAMKDKMMARVKEMMPAMQKCGADAKVQAAMQRMDGSKAPAKAETKAPPADTKTAAPPAKK